VCAIADAVAIPISAHKQEMWHTIGCCLP